MPDVAEPPPKTGEPPETLKALFQIPSDLVESAEPEVAPEKEPEPEKPPVKPTEKPVVEQQTASASTVEEPKKTDLASRLAPDFTALDTPPVVAQPEVVITDEMIAAAKTPKAQADMRKFREAHDALKKEVETLRSRPAAPVENPDTKVLLETLQKERDDALARLEKYDLSATPAFQEKYLKPRQQKFDNAYSIVKDAGGNPDALAHAMSLTGKPRIEALEEIAESIPQQMMRGRFERLIEAIDADSRIINEKLENAKLAAQEEAKNETIRRFEKNKKMAEEAKSLLGAARSTLLEKVKLETLRKVGKPEYEWWDKQVDKIDQTAQEIYLESTPEEAAIAAYLAASAGPLLSMLNAEREARLAVVKENRELKGADPTLTQDRRAPKIEGDGVGTDDILGRLHAGAYKRP